MLADHASTAARQERADPLNDALWIAWERQRRNHSLSRLLGVRLVEVTSSAGRPWKYLVLAARTLAVLRRERPRIVFFQNPSLILAMLVAAVRRPFGFFAVMDAHNAGLEPLDGRSRLLNYIAGVLLRHVDLVVVSNRLLLPYVEAAGGEAIAVPDPLPEIPGASADLTTSPDRALELLFICSWASDEPWREVLEAAAMVLNLDIRITITGRPSQQCDTASLPPNVTLAGFLSDEAYGAALRRADGVIVLSTLDHCLNCGIYEAVSVEKPGIATDTEAIRSYFQSGFVYAENSGPGIAEAIRLFYRNRPLLTAGVRTLRQEYLLRRDSDRERLMHCLPSPRKVEL